MSGSGTSPAKRDHERLKRERAERKAVDRAERRAAKRSTRPVRAVAPKVPARTALAEPEDDTGVVDEAVPDTPTPQCAVCGFEAPRGTWLYDCTSRSTEPVWVHRLCVAGGING